MCTPAASPFHGFLSMQSRGVLALSPELRRKYLLDQPGAQVEVTELDDGVPEIRPTVAVLVQQTWFWSEAWQALGREADEDIAVGPLASYSDADSFLADLSA